jgi:hypothetical protein
MLPQRSVLLALGLAALFSFPAFAAEPGFTSLFNGKDLNGWSGLEGFWSVQDGTITGQTTAEKTPKANTFLVWQGGEVRNFELRLSYRLHADNPDGRANSGIQFRSKLLDPVAFIVSGYQADLDFARPQVGMLYEERGRGILMKPGETVRIVTGADGNHRVEPAGPAADPAATVAAAYRKGEWNELRIVAEGNRIRHWFNGTLTADVTDLDEPRAAKSGVLAFQIHTGLPMRIQFKDIRLKHLPWEFGGHRALPRPFGEHWVVWGSPYRGGDGDPVYVGPDAEPTSLFVDTSDG